MLLHFQNVHMDVMEMIAEKDVIVKILLPVQLNHVPVKMGGWEKVVMNVSKTNNNLYYIRIQI